MIVEIGRVSKKTRGKANGIFESLMNWVGQPFHEP